MDSRRPNIIALCRNKFQFDCRKASRRSRDLAINKRGSDFQDVDQKFNFSNLRISQIEDEYQQTAINDSFSMRDAIEEQRYDLVHFNLRNISCPNDPNEEIKFDTVYMTGLEYSIHNGDWKMAILFFINSADPAYNCFDGTILRYSKSLGRYVQSHSHPAFLEERNSRTGDRRRKSVRIAGFDGLYCLVNPKKRDLDKIMSSLWLMKQAHEIQESSAKKTMMETIACSRKHIFNIGYKDIWKTQFCTIIHTCLLCLRCCINNHCHQSSKSQRGKLPNDVSIHILEYIMDDLLCDVIQEVLRVIARNVIMNKG